MTSFWQSRFVVPAGAVELFLEVLEPHALSIAAFENADSQDGEIADGGDGAAVDWRIELLHETQPDRGELLVLVAPLAQQLGLAPPDIEIQALPEEDWIRRVQAEHRPQQIGRFWIHGSHVQDEPPRGLVPVELDAGLAFGSGEHESTKGCLLALDRLARQRPFRQVLDMGCGAGVLGIAAAKCWPARVVGVDNDPVAVEIARENARRNDVSRRMRFLVSEGYAAPAIALHGLYDLILANILADPLCAMARACARHLSPEGEVVLAGLLDRQAAAVMAAHQVHGLRLRMRIDKGHWTTLVMSRKKF